MKTLKTFSAIFVLAFVFCCGTTINAGAAQISGNDGVQEYSQLSHHHGGPHGPRGGWGCGGC